MITHDQHIRLSSLYERILSLKVEATKVLDEAQAVVDDCDQLDNTESKLCHGLVYSLEWTDELVLEAEGALFRILHDIKES